MFDLFRRLRRAPATLDPVLWSACRARVPWVAALDDARAARLSALAARFLHEKTITPLDDLALDDVDRACLAALCCLPLLEYGPGGFAGWSQLLVYPDAFRVKRSHEDAAGVLHETEDELIGEAWDAGPVILSWADVQQDFADPRAGFCVAVHEMAHKLDLLDGVFDGTPLLPRVWQRKWARDFAAAYERFARQVDGGRRTRIDAYAAESPDEFFAVLSEYHFSRPALLQREMPEVAAHLARFYGASPFAGSDLASG